MQFVRGVNSECVCVEPPGTGAEQRFTFKTSASESHHGCNSAVAVTHTRGGWRDQEENSPVCIKTA